MPLADEVMNAFLQNLEQLNEAAENAGWEATAHVVEDIRAGAVRDTGSMADGVYHKDGKRSTYGEASATAAGENDRAVILSEEEVRQSKEIYEALVAESVLHGFMVENGYGPEGRRPAKPFFEPGLTNAEDHYMNALKI